MAQSGDTTPITSKNAVLSFLSALKSGAQQSGAKSDLFASFLAETKVPSMGDAVQSRAPEIMPQMPRKSTLPQEPAKTQVKVDFDVRDEAPVREIVRNESQKTAAPKAHEEKGSAVQENKVTQDEAPDPIKNKTTKKENADEVVATQAAAPTTKNTKTEETSEADAALLAFLASLNPLDETTKAVVGEGKAIGEEKDEKEMAAVASHIEAEIKSLLGELKKTTGDTVAGEQVKETKEMEVVDVKATIEGALALKAKQRGIKEGEVGLPSEKDIDVDEDGELLATAARGALKPEEDVYAKGKQKGAKEASFEEAALLHKQDKEVGSQTPLTASVSGDSLKKAVENLTSQTSTAKTTSVGEAGSHNTLGGGVRSADTYSFASQLSAARVTRGGNTGLPTPVEQIAIQINKMAKSGNEEMTINLKPAELGRVQIKLEFSPDQKVQVLVMADNQSSLDLMMKDQDSLARALQNAGIQVDSGSLEFSLNENQQNKAFEDNMKGSKHAKTEVENDNEKLALEDDLETYYVTPERVNLRV